MSKAESETVKAPLGPTILQIIPNLDTGGAELATIEIADALIRSGARALVATEGGRLSGDLEALGAEILSLPVATKNPLRIWRNAARLAKLIEERDVALIHARSRAPAWSGLLAARRTGRPFVTTYHGAYGNKGPLKSAYNGVMARADLVIANSQFTKQLIQARHATPDERLRVIYRGVDLDRFAPDAVSPERVARLSAKWGVADGDLVLLQAARLTGWKGQEDVIAAAALLRERAGLGRCLFILAGDDQGRDSYRAGLEDRIARAGLAERVRLVGHCDDMPAAFLLAHASILASREPEAFGRAGAECQAMGCPVIATNIGAPPETVLAPPRVPPGESTGWFVPPNRPDALADALEMVLALDADERKTIGEHAVLNVRAKFSLTAMKASTLAVYDELLGTDMATRFSGNQANSAHKSPCG